MDTPETAWLEHLKTLAANDVVRLEAIGPEGLEDLLARGVIQKDERLKQASLESQYEALQETHRAFIEARTCLERLQLRLAPRSRLASLWPASAPSPPGPDDPLVQRLFELLASLKLQVREVTDPGQVPARLDSIQEYLYVESRECLDRLAETDRKIDLLQKDAPSGSRVEGVGYFTLTRSGEAALPEAPVLEALETCVHTAFGPLTHRSTSAAHFREEPGSLAAFLMEGLARGERPSDQMASYENLLDAFERISSFSGIRSLRAKISFLVRLLRSARGEPKQAFRWCSRDRLQDLASRINKLVPATMAGSGWHLPYAVDLFLAGGGLQGDEAELERRGLLYAAVQAVQGEFLWDTRIGDGQSVRLGIALAQAARSRGFAPGRLMDRFIRQALETLGEASQSAPYDLGDRGTRLLFGYHLAYAAGFAKTRLQAPLETFRAIHARLRGDGPTSPITFQILLHAFATLDRLQRLGAPMDLDTHAGIQERMRKRLRHHKVLSQAFQVGPYRAGDEAMFAANLAARVCFQQLPPAPDPSFHPDAGAAGLYEEPNPRLPPALGAAFGTLMLI